MKLMTVSLIVLVAALTPLAAYAGLGWIERRQVYQFDTQEVDPAWLGLDGVRAVDVQNADGGRLIVWFAAPAPGQPVIFYLHGNAGDLANRAQRIAIFRAWGYGVIMPSYRGSSGSAGRPGQRAITADVRQLWQQRGALLAEAGAGAEAGAASQAPVIVYGESLGSGVAVAGLLASPAAQADPPAALVLEAPFTSIPAVARALAPGLALLNPVMQERWDSLANVAHVTMPLMVLHGDRDPLIPFAQGRQLFEAAPSADKRFLPVAGAGHNDLWRPVVIDSLRRFIDTRGQVGAP